MSLFEEQKITPPPGVEKGEYCEMCGKTGRWLDLTKCPMCHRYFCESCRVSMGGKDFCTRHCANEFFWGGEDES
ncbi:MAG: hypothetical protein P8Z49_12195 [Acidobacteriota bacterium]